MPSRRSTISCPDRTSWSRRATSSTAERARNTGGCAVRHRYRPVDSHPLRGRDELAAIVATHPQVVRLVSGHIHRACEVAFGGTVASTAPSTAHQLILDREQSGGYTLRLEPPGFVMHRWTGRALTSEICPTTGRAAPHLRAVS